MNKSPSKYYVKLTGDSDMAIGLPLFNNLKDLLGAAHKPLCGSFHVHNFVLVLMYSKVDL